LLISELLMIIHSDIQLKHSCRNLSNVLDNGNIRWFGKPYFFLALLCVPGVFAVNGLIGALVFTARTLGTQGIVRKFAILLYCTWVELIVN
jgi:hypothetical protein